MSERIDAINKQNERATEFLRKHAKGLGGVGFGDVDPEPLVQESIQVNGEIVVVDNGHGKKEITPKARAATLQNGEVIFISGAMGAQINVQDMRKVLDRRGKIELAKALNADEENKKKHLLPEIV